MDTAFGWPSGTVRGALALIIIVAIAVNATKVIWFSQDPQEVLQLLKELGLLVLGFYFAKAGESQPPPNQPPRPPTA